VIAAAGKFSDSAVIRALRLGGLHHRRLFDDSFCRFGRVAEDNGDLRR
jgi:hypothetical protein